LITIKTDRLTIRESSGRDFSRIYAMLLSVNDQPLSGSLAYEVSTDENEELEKYLAYIHTVYPVFGIGLCSVVLNETAELIGWCGLQPIGDEDTPMGRIELGYLIDAPYRGKGYAYEACRAILAFAFEKLELDCVYAQIDENNEASVRLARRLGFTPEKGALWIAVP